MNHRFIIYVFIISAKEVPLYSEAENQTSRVIIYNNHTITQTVSTSSNEYDTTPNRHPGHTKNETATHRVDITPLPSTTPKADLNYPSATVIDNAHTISQHATHSSDRSRSIDPLLSDALKPTSNDHAYNSWKPTSSWLAPFVPPIIAQSATAQYILGAIGLSYAALTTKLLYTSYITLQKKDTWSYWKEEISLETMRSHEKQVAQELFTAMQNHYKHAPANACFLSPLVYFINDIDAELYQLTSFIWAHRFIDKFNLNFMFPTQKEGLTLTHEKIHRLEYFKTIIINWVGEYKA